MATVAIVRTRNGIPESAEVTHLIIRDAHAVVVYPSTVVPPTAPGTYSVSVSLGAGTYTATWTFTMSGFPDDEVARLFTLDEPAVITDGISLMAIERAVARRVGPYWRFVAESGSGIQKLVTGRLKSRLNLGSYEDHFLLRRGVTADNLLIPLYEKDDRIRIVADYDPDEGALVADRDWFYGPDSTNGEMVEVMYLDPDLELRPSVTDALKRCYFWDTFTVSGTQPGYNAQVNLTAVVPWVTQPSQVKAVGYAQVGNSLAPQLLPWWRISRSGKTLTLWTQGTSLGNLTVVALRPVSSLVNEELSLVGPNDDLDLLYTDLDYAAWAGIVELWKNIPERLQPLIHEGLRTDLKAAAAEFTKKSLIIAQQIPDTFQVNFGYDHLAAMQIGNLPEVRV